MSRNATEVLPQLLEAREEACPLAPGDCDLGSLEAPPQVGARRVDDRLRQNAVGDAREDDLLDPVGGAASGAAAEKDARPVRLIVRRVRPTPGSQLALFTLYDYHAFITDREGETLELEADHRRHAEIENAIRDLRYGMGLNHVPSRKFAANAAWLAAQVMAHNLAGGPPGLVSVPGSSRRRRSGGGCSAWSDGSPGVRDA